MKAWTKEFSTEKCAWKAPYYVMWNEAFQENNESMDVEEKNVMFQETNNILRLGNTNIYRSQQCVIRDSPITTFERVGEVSRL